MAKITAIQKNNIKALILSKKMTMLAIAKKYKVDIKVITRIRDEIPPENFDIVEAESIIKKIKKSKKSPTEIATIDKAVEHILTFDNQREKLEHNITDVSNILLLKIKNKIVKGSTKKPMKVKNQDYEQIEVIEHEHTSNDLVNFANAIDKISITTNVNQRHASTTIALQANQTSNILANEDEVKDILKALDVNC